MKNIFITDAARAVEMSSDDPLTAEVLRDTDGKEVIALVKRYYGGKRKVRAFRALDEEGTPSIHVNLPDGRFFLVEDWTKRPATVH